MNHTTVAVFVALLVGGCASSGVKLEEVSDKDMNAFLADKPAQMHGHYRNVLVEGERNVVLNLMRTGVAAYELGDHEAAKRDFDEVIQRIDSIYADTPGAKKARKKFHAEKNKEFKGESYERAMAHYYRGLLYLEDEDYENARASFLSAQLQDTLAEEEDYAADFASVEWLAGWASHCQARTGKNTSSFSRLAGEHFIAAEKQRSGLERPGSSDNLLVIVETGAAPLKVASDRGVEYLEYRRGKHTFGRPSLLVNSRNYKLAMGEDVFHQASTRGGRQVDVVNAGKAEFKQSAQDTAVAAAGVGRAGMETASGLLNIGKSTGNYSSDLVNAAGAAAAIGLLSGIVSGVSSAAAKRTKPDADLRYWDNLPDKIYLGSVHLNNPDIDVELKVGNKSIEKSNLAYNPVGCDIVWARTESATSIPATHPNAR
jgi:hypothetical protein